MPFKHESSHFTYQQEVRLTSLRKLHTECDLHSMSAPPAIQNNTRSLSIGPINPVRSQEPTVIDIEQGNKRTMCPSATCLGTCCSRTSHIDKHSRAVFPLAFLCFNILYWVSYLHVSRKPQHDDFVLIK